MDNNLKKFISSTDTVLIYDLEFTSWEGSNKRNWSLPDEAREFIQIGTVIIETEGVLFPQALSQFIKFIEKNSASISSNGRNDTVIEENCNIHNIPSPPIFTKSTNLKPYFSEFFGIPQSKCVSAMLPDLVGINNYEKSHDAVGDAKSIFQTLKFLRMKEHL